MAANLTWWLAVFSGERAPERAEKPLGEWEKCSRSTTIMFQVFRSWGRREEMWEGKTGRCGVGVRVSLPHRHLLIFLPLSYFAQHSTNSTPGIGYDYKQTASYTGVPRTRLNKLKNSALVLQIAINTETYVIKSTTILKSFYSVYIHLLKCPPQSHCQFHCPPLFSLQDGVTFISPVALTEPLTTAPVLKKLVFT